MPVMIPVNMAWIVAGFAALTVTAGDLNRVAGITQTDKIGAFDDTTRSHVEAGNNAFGQHRDQGLPPKPAAVAKRSASA